MSNSVPMISYLAPVDALVRFLPILAWLDPLQAG